MDRHQWNETVGHNDTIMDDLEWRIFTARRCLANLLKEALNKDTLVDQEMISAFANDRDDARIALIGLYSRIK